jgi:hypothetical protein
MRQLHLLVWFRRHAIRMLPSARPERHSVVERRQHLLAFYYV